MKYLCPSALLAVVMMPLHSSDGSIPASLTNQELPWSDLTERLSPSATLNEASNEVFAAQCDPGFDKPQPMRWDEIIDAESGLCMNSYACAFEHCLPTPDHSASIADNLSRLYNAEYNDVMEWKDPSNPNYGLPSSVLFPATAGDIVAAVDFANENKIELSVKSSGHSYSSQSSTKNSLLLNTVRYKKYSTTGIVECDANSTSTIVNMDLSNQPCILSLAKNKNAYIRVATGEPFRDVYQSIHDFNEAQEEYKYFIAGGGAVTVTPMGWTFNGGLPGTTMGRWVGNGVDQVLTIEAVLPTGEHVRFGPTSFEDVEGYSVPRTTVVSGVCNTNPEEAEELWVWETCTKEINFDDLWFAIRGGGGGTYGIVTSIYLQLHDYLPLELITLSFDDCLNDEDTEIILPVFKRFFLEFMLEPALIGVSNEESSACSKPDSPSYLFCYGEGTGQRFVDAWKGYVSNAEILLKLNISESLMATAATCLDDQLQTPVDFLTAIPTDFNIGPGPSVFPVGTDFGGTPVTPVGIPIDFYLENKESMIGIGLSIYFAVGGQGNLFGHDQTTSFPSTIRNAAGYIYNEILASPISNRIADAYNISSTDTAIPGYLGPNHMSPYAYGPLKSDPTQPCDLETFTFQEAEEKCYSAQEAIWGSEVLARLEAIKKVVDPNHILNCYKCVGSKGATFEEVSSGQSTTTTPVSSNGVPIFRSVTSALAPVMAAIISLIPW